MHSPRRKLFAKRAARNVIDFCLADWNLSSKSLACYFQSKKHKSKAARQSLKRKKKKTARLTCGGRSRPPPSIDRWSPQPRSLQVSFRICRAWILIEKISYFPDRFQNKKWNAPAHSVRAHLQHFQSPPSYRAHALSSVAKNSLTQLDMEIVKKLEGLLWWERKALWRETRLTWWFEP